MENITVTGEFGRKPSLAFEGAPSPDLLVEVLHQGDGQVVEAGDTRDQLGDNDTIDRHLACCDESICFTTRADSRVGEELVQT